MNTPELQGYSPEEQEQVPAIEQEVIDPQAEILSKIPPESYEAMIRSGLTKDQIVEYFENNEGLLN